MASEGGATTSFFYVLEDPVRILFVDDDPIMREFAAVHLSTDTAKVTVAADGVDALRALAADAFDVILLDLDMPVMDGFEVLSRLRAEARTARAPVIVVTGREDVAAVDRAFQAGATSFLPKPINWRLLSYQIRYVHRSHESEMNLLRQRSRARAEAERAEEAVKRLATHGVALLREAMRGAPELRRLAAGYADVLEETAGVVRGADEGETERPSV